MSHHWLLAPMMGLLVLAGLPGQLPVASGQPAAGPDLERLALDERAMVERNLERWHRAGPAERQRMLDNYRRWKSMSPEQRDAAR